VETLKTLLNILRFDIPAERILGYQRGMTSSLSSCLLFFKVIVDGVSYRVVFLACITFK